MHFSDPSLLSLLGQGLSETRSRARSDSRPFLHRTTVPIEAPEDLLALVERARDERQTCFFVERAADRTAILGIGSEWSATARGPQRFPAVLDACRGIARDVVADRSSTEHGIPLVLAGFGFSDDESDEGDLWQEFPPAYVFVPRLLIVRRGRTATLTVSAFVRPGQSIDEAASLHGLLQGGGVARTASSGSTRYEAMAEPAPFAWKDAVARTVGDIRQGRFEKLVLARTCRITSNVRFDVVAVLRRLRLRYPTCSTFCFVRADRAFVGATPERLVRLQDGVVETAAIAGSIARGGSPAEDRALAHALVESTKDRGEQAVVVRALVQALQGLCDSVEVGVEPEILSLENVQHLRTAIRGRLRSKRHVLDIVRMLHPSPAVGGFPREEALAAMRKRETQPRGWYAGPIGWFDQNGDGEFWVAIRSALLRGNEALLYAGAGIVADSSPETELAETRLKLQPMLSALMEL